MGGTWLRGHPSLWDSQPSCTCHAEIQSPQWPGCWCSSDVREKTWRCNCAARCHIKGNPTGIFSGISTNASTLQKYTHVCRICLNAVVQACMLVVYLPLLHWYQLVAINCFGIWGNLRYVAWKNGHATATFGATVSQKQTWLDGFRKFMEA